MLERVWFRHTLVFVFTIAALALAPQPAPWLGAIMWVMAGVAAATQPNDRETVLRSSSQFLVGYAAAAGAYKILLSVVNLESLVRELGVSVGAEQSVANTWARNTALTIFGSSFLIPIYFSVWWAQIMFWRRGSRFFRAGATNEEQQAMIKRGGTR